VWVCVCVCVCVYRAVAGRADSGLAERAELGATDATVERAELAVGIVERAELVAGLKSNGYGAEECRLWC
jgi:hypothetical protein